MRILFFIILGAGFYLPLSLTAGDLEAGKIKAQKSCAVCHGLDGQASVPLAAHLSGQQKDYLIIQMRAYRSGKRQHDQMGFIAKPLTNEEIDNLAEWYSNISVTIEAPKDSESETKEVPSEPTTTSTLEENKNVTEEKGLDPDAIKSIQDSLQAFIKDK